YEALLHPGDLAIDIGAHQGRHCIPMAEQVFPTGRVLAFEPLSTCCEQVSKEVAQYRPELSAVLTLYPFALSDFTGTAPFVVAKEALAYSGLKERHYDWPTPLERILVEVKTLDEVSADLPSLRYIKIDAEGGEYHILKGGVNCLRRFRPVVNFEFGLGAADVYHVSRADMARFWTEQEYKIYSILGNCLSAEDFTRNVTAQVVYDYVAVPAENVGLEQIIVEVLTGPPAWHRVATHLDMAAHTANTGGSLPLMRRFRGIRRWLARLLARPILLGTQVITRPQRAYNHALVRSLRALLKILRLGERQTA